MIRTISRALLGIGLFAILAAPTTSKDLTITVTPGQVGTSGTITTVSIQNADPAKPVVPGATGYPYIIGQVFARSNGNGVPSTGLGNYPACQDASNAAPLTCQWDDIATRRENGDDGSWRHAVLSVLLPASSPQYTAVAGGNGLAPCTTAPPTGQPCAGQFQVALVNTNGAYSSTSQGSINDICNGHDIKLVFTDVRNQDDSLRGPSSATSKLTFDTCNAIHNSGRDAPTQYARGPVRNAWIVRGPPLYSDNSADPLLYVICFMEQTYAFGGGLGPLRHVCEVYNSWMNVAAGTKGNAGNPGPAGFANDPQLVSYRAAVYDGSALILDIGANFDATVANNSFNTTSHAWTIPSSITGSNNVWGRGMGFRYTSPSPPGGLTSGKIVYACGNVDCGTGAGDLTLQFLSTTPWPGQAGTIAYTGSAGSGNSNFSFRVVHYHGTSWETLDPTAAENWAPVGSTARYTSPLLPYFHAAERTYLEQTGAILPLADVSQNSHFRVDAGWSYQFFDRYAPMDQNNMPNGQGGGSRPQLGLTNEFFSRAFSLQSAAGWQSARVAARSQGANATFSSVLNEATGHVPVLNNGPPGPNHAGAGGTYSGLGANFNNTGAHFSGYTSGSYTMPLEGVPIAAYTQYYMGTTSQVSPTDTAHASSITNGYFQLFGAEDTLWAAYRQATWMSMEQLDGRNRTAVNGVTYYDTYAGCCERRGAAWFERDLMLGAYYGADSMPERSYFGDVITEDYYYALADNWTHEPITPDSGCILPAMSAQGCTRSGTTSVFFDYYVNVTYATLWGVSHAPKAKDYLSQQYRGMSASCGNGVVANSPSGFYCGSYYYWANVHNSNPFVFNSVDALDFGPSPSAYQCPSFKFTNASSIIKYYEGQNYDFMDTNVRIQFVPISDDGLGGALPPQLHGGTIYWMVNPTPVGTDPFPNSGPNGFGTNPATFQISATKGGPALGPFSVSDTGIVECAFERHDAGTPEGGAYFQDPGYGPYALAGLDLLEVVNPSLGSIMPAITTVHDAAWSRVKTNSQGWLGPDDSDTSTFTQMHLDNTIVQQ